MANFKFNVGDQVELIGNPSGFLKGEIHTSNSMSEGKNFYGVRWECSIQYYNYSEDRLHLADKRDSKPARTHKHPLTNIFV